jgi:hypothetical protein
MCFSATASFVSGAVLSTIGIATIAKAKGPQKAFASIPFLFGVQQFSEGVLWITLPDHSAAGLSHAMTYVYLFFAQVVWPVWVPLSILMMEKVKWRRNYLSLVLCLGGATSVYLAYCILNFNVRAEIGLHHVRYVLDFPNSLVPFGEVFYFIATIAPPFLSRGKDMSLVGFALLGSFIFSRIFYGGFVISVWCFFAALLSAVILLILTQVNAAAKHSEPDRFHE